MIKVFYATFLILSLSMFCSAQWVKYAVTTTASLRGLSVVSEKIVWASGTGGTVIKTSDGGMNWKVMTVPGAEKLDFRDIEAFNANTAYVLSIGNGDTSRIYKTTDGGATWKLQFTNHDAKAFYDAIACWDRSSCIAMSDPVNGHYVLLTTVDGGETWKQIDTSKMPPVKDGEAAFAASGTCLIVHGKSGAFLVSGGTDARVFHTADRGNTWTVADSPIARGTAGSGIFSIAMLDKTQGVVVGGDYEKPGDLSRSLAFTNDGGRTWKASTGLSGYRSGVTFVDGKRIVAVGTNGADISTDRGKTWKKIGDYDLNAVASKGKDAVWAVGPKGGVFRYPGFTPIILDGD